MKLYNCQVRLSGNVNHVVPKYACTEHEILILRTLHGNDAVVFIKQVGEDKDRTEKGEFSRLAAIYGQDKVESLFMIKLDLNTSFVEDDASDTSLDNEIGIPKQQTKQVASAQKVAA